MKISKCGPMGGFLKVLQFMQRPYLRVLVSDCYPDEYSHSAIAVMLLSGQAASQHPRAGITIAAEKNHDRSIFLRR